MTIQDHETRLYIGELEIGFLHLLKDSSSYRFKFLPRDGGVTPGSLAPQFELSRIRQILRNPKPDVRKIAIGIAREWPRASHRQMLYRDLRVRHRGHLGGN